MLQKRMKELRLQRGLTQNEPAAVLHTSREAYSMYENGKRQLSCQGLARNAVFTGMMQKMLKTLQRVYGSPVDIEYTINLGEEGDFVVNLLQCRPLQTCEDEEKVDIPQIPEENAVIHIRDCCMGRSRSVKISAVVKVDAFE